MAHELQMEQFTRECLFRKSDVKDVEPGLFELSAPAFRDDRSLAFKGFEFIEVAEKRLRFDEEMYEMSVGIPDEFVHAAVGKDFHLVVYIPEHVSERHAVQCVRLNYRNAWIHGEYMDLSASKGTNFFDYRKLIHIFADLNL